MTEETEALRQITIHIIQPISRKLAEVCPSNDITFTHTGKDYTHADKEGVHGFQWDMSYTKEGDKCNRTVVIQKIPFPRYPFAALFTIKKQRPMITGNPPRPNGHQEDIILINQHFIYTNVTSPHYPFHDLVYSMKADIERDFAEVVYDTLANPIFLQFKRKQQTTPSRLVMYTGRRYIDHTYTPYISYIIEWDNQKNLPRHVELTLNIDKNGSPETCKIYYHGLEATLTYSKGSQTPASFIEEISDHILFYERNHAYITETFQQFTWNDNTSPKQKGIDLINRKIDTDAQNNFPISKVLERVVQISDQHHTMIERISKQILSLHQRISILDHSSPY